MMRISGFRRRMQGRERLSGTFVKIPEVSVAEVLSDSGLDFLCFDAEHASWDRGRLDACLAVTRALDMPVLVRIGAATEVEVLRALDAGAVGVVVPHVWSREIAERVARAAHFGRGGRGFAGSTRWAGFASRPMGDVLRQDGETVVIAQIEEPEGVEAVEQIAAVQGIDAVFAGPADLSVGYGQTRIGSPELEAALARIGAAAAAANKTAVSWVPDARVAGDWARAYGMRMFFVASDHSWLKAGARTVAEGIAALGDA